MVSGDTREKHKTARSMILLSLMMMVLCRKRIILSISNYDYQMTCPACCVRRSLRSVSVLLPEMAPCRTFPHEPKHKPERQYDAQDESCTDET